MKMIKRYREISSVKYIAKNPEQVKKFYVACIINNFFSSIFLVVILCVLYYLFLAFQYI